jgi:asparagine synthase (glutamine-hydrolysing)
MFDSTKEHAIIFNGEIYNFQSIKKQLQKAGKFFHSTGDTEVLLEAYKYWGLDFVKKLKGMFVFSIYDRKNSKIYIFRDISGEKPIYFSYENKNISFSSEIKCLLHENPDLKEIDEFSLKKYLAFGFIPGEN